MRSIESITLRLEQAGIGVRGVTIFAGTGADIPNAGTIITVTETGGQRPIGTHNAGSLRQPAFQVVARSTDYRQAAAKIDQAYSALVVNNTMIGDVFWLRIGPIQEPFPLPVDANGRSRLAFNIETIRR